jgi:hypothetical protein
LIDRLKKLRGRAHIILANGSDESGDGNAAARADLESADVDVHDRLLGSKGLGHNKFAIVVRTAGRVPIRAWTGSTNWAATGLCTQLNNAIAFDDPSVAQTFLDQWDRIDDAGSSFTTALVQANAQSPRTTGNVDAWFTRVRNKSTLNVGLGKDLQALIDLVNGAQEAVLYVMFQPGPEPLKTALLKAASTYVRGVVSTVTGSNREAFELSGITARVYNTALVQYASSILITQLLSGPHPEQVKGTAEAVVLGSGVLLHEVRGDESPDDPMGGADAQAAPAFPRP